MTEPRWKRAIQRMSIATILIVPIAVTAFIAWTRVKEPVASRWTSWFDEQRGRPEARRRARELERVHALNARPPAALPVSDKDRRRHPRHSFQVVYRGYYGFGVDTASGTATQDRVSDPDTTIALVLPEAQVDTLYEWALAGHFFDMDPPPDLLPGWAGAGGHGGELTLRAGDHERVFRWIPWSTDVVWSDDHKRLTEFVRVVQRMVQHHPSFMALPRPRSVYID